MAQRIPDLLQTICKRIQRGVAQREMDDTQVICGGVFQHSAFSHHFVQMPSHGGRRRDIEQHELLHGQGGSQMLVMPNFYRNIEILAGFDAWDAGKERAEFFKLLKGLHGSLVNTPLGPARIGKRHTERKTAFRVSFREPLSIYDSPDSVNRQPLKDALSVNDANFLWALILLGFYGFCAHGLC